MGKGAEEEREEKSEEKNQRSNTKSMGADLEGVFFCGKKKSEQNHILLDTRDKSLLSGFLSLEKEKSFFCL